MICGDKIMNCNKFSKSDGITVHSCCEKKTVNGRQAIDLMTL